MTTYAVFHEGDDERSVCLAVESTEDRALEVGITRMLTLGITSGSIVLSRTNNDEAAADLKRVIDAYFEKLDNKDKEKTC